MSIVVLDAMESENSLTDAIKEVCKERVEELIHFRLKDMNILPCRSCGACGYKSPGKCVAEDDAHEILRAIARSGIVILLTPIRFGGYTSTMKKIVDKFMNLCLPSYTVKHGHLLHPARYGSKFLLGIGAYEGESKDEGECFARLVENNALNLQYPCRTIILKPSGDAGKVRQEIDSILREVC
ncbi:MAG: flavodoxin family protein [Caulobacteraceae bacterium]